MARTLATTTIVPTLSHWRRTSSPLRRRAPIAERCSSSAAGTMSAHRTASQTAIGTRKSERVRSVTTVTAIARAPISGLTLSSDMR